MKPDAVKPSSRTLCRHNRWGAKPAMYLASVLFALASMSAMAAETSIWQGGTTGIWGVGYEGNWDVYPDSTRYAQFGSPYDEAIAVTVNESVDTYGIVNASSRTAGISFTGSGTINNYRATLFSNSSAPSLTDWNVDVVCKNTADWSSYIEGTNVFHKALVYEGRSDQGDTCYTKNKASVTLCGSAQMTAQHVKIVSGSSFEMKDSSTATLVKDLRVEPGASFRIADGAVLALRALFLPFSQEEGTDEEWVMEGGEIRANNFTDTNCRVDLAYTNATKTISGTGTFHVWRFNGANSSGLVLRLNGPSMYVHDFYISSSSPAYNKNRFEIGGGSTIGLWGGDALFDRWTNRVVGAATVDTTDYADKTTPRTLTLSKFFDCNGVLTVKGVGTCSLSSPEQPNLSIVGTETSTTTCANGYALGDIVLTDSAKFTCTEYMGHKTEESFKNVKSLTMDEDSSLNVKRYVILTGDATLSGNASAVVRNGNGESNPIFTCDNLSLSDNASLSVTGTIAATSLTMSGNAHLAFTAGTAFSAGAAFGAGNWTMEITIPSGYEAGIRPVVIGAGFEGNFADHVTLLGDTTGWSAQTLDGSLILYKDAPASGIEWIGKSSTGDNWSDSANWNGGNVPTSEDIVAFGGLDRLTPYNDSLGTVSGLVFRASAGPFTLSGTDALTLTAASGGRSSVTASTAPIVSHSAFDQTVSSFVNFADGNCGVFSDGGGALKLTGGFNAPNSWRYFVVGGDVRINGTCSVGILSLRASTSGIPTCLTVLPGCKFTIRNQYFRGIVEETKYIGRIVVEEGAEMTVKDGDCVFWYGGLENVIDGTLSIKSDQDSGRLVGGPNEQYYTGKGEIYAASARSGRTAAVADHYINFGGTLKLYMNGDWYTATYRNDGSSEGTTQNPNFPTRFRMTDGTTLGATKDWVYGPREGAYDATNRTITAADRTSIMTGTVTVNTQSPKDDAAHTITFYDPLDASAANIVKAGAGSLVFNSTNNCPSQISNLTVNAGTVLLAGDVGPALVSASVNAGTLRVDAASTMGSMTVADGAVASFAAVPTFSGTLALASAGSDFLVDGHAAAMEWELLATASDIVGPDGAMKWNAGNQRRFKIEEEGGAMKLFGSRGGSFVIIFR